MMFRRQALHQLSAPEQLDEAVRLASAPGWLLTAVLAAVVAGAFGWASVDTVPRTVSAIGVLIHSNGVTVFDAPQGGQVVKVWVTANQPVTAGTPVYSVRGADGRIVTMNAPWDANVVALVVSEGQVIQPGSRIAELERLNAPGEQLEAVVFVPAALAPRLLPGVPAQVTTPVAPSTVFGTMRGTVSTVGAFPETEETLHTLLGAGRDVRPLLAKGSVIRVIVPLLTDPASPTGLHWSKTSPPFGLTTQTQVTALFTVARERPIDWLLNR
jgi:multidrug efflux pump subunit AcrA (membrane-fusion protein)